MIQDCNCEPRLVPVVDSAGTLILVYNTTTLAGTNIAYMDLNTLRSFIDDGEAFKSNTWGELVRLLDSDATFLNQCREDVGGLYEAYVCLDGAKFINPEDDPQWDHLPRCGLCKRPIFEGQG